MLIKSETNEESSSYRQFYWKRERVTGILSARRERSERLESLSLLHQDSVPPLPFSKKSLTIRAKSCSLSWLRLNPPPTIWPPPPPPPPTPFISHQSPVDTHTLQSMISTSPKNHVVFVLTAPITTAKKTTTTILLPRDTSQPSSTMKLYSLQSHFLSPNPRTLTKLRGKKRKFKTKLNFTYSCEFCFFFFFFFTKTTDNNNNNKYYNYNYKQFMRFCFAKFENVFGPFWFEAREREKCKRKIWPFAILLRKWYNPKGYKEREREREREREELLELESELEGKTTGKGIQYKVANLLWNDVIALYFWLRHQVSIEILVEVDNGGEREFWTWTGNREYSFLSTSIKMWFYHLRNTPTTIFS